MNILGAIAVAASILAFALTYSCLRKRSAPFRLGMFGAFAVLAIPSLLFAVYYLHVLSERAWFYTFRSWTGTEFLVVFLGCTGGAAASLLHRFLLGVPLFAVIAVAVVPYVKPLMMPIPDSLFHEHWQDEVCLQSTPSTCGPASVSTIMKQLGGAPSEKATARAAHSYAGGTEAWYLARYVRSQGFRARFDFRETFTPSVGVPAVVGVRLGSAGHFIAVLEVSGDRVTVADPLRGKERLSLAEFYRRYEFTGFHMVITKV